MTTKRYLIGRGELLTEPIGPPPIRPNKVHPYSIEESRARLAPQLATVIQGMSGNSMLSPNDVRVVKFALHPAYVAKTYFPSTLFNSAGLEPVGSRNRRISPTAHVRANWMNETYDTSEIFVAGTRRAFQSLSDKLSGNIPLPRELDQIREVEEISSFTANEKVKPSSNAAKGYELVLHLPSNSLSPANQSSFLDLARELGFTVREDLAFQVRGLWFLPAEGPSDRLHELAAFTTVRLIRPMPSLSVLPEARAIVSAGVAANLPTMAPLSDRPRVAILDGGLPADHALSPWIDSYREMNATASNSPGYEQHGIAVASAFLFGPLRPGITADAPPSRVSIFRILDDSTSDEDSFELYRTLGYVEEVLLSGNFDFINLSLGPTLPVEDDEVHAWTALIDELLSNGETLMTVAVGNTGERDWTSGNARIQIPGDAVNALSVGAADLQGEVWQRAAYSSIGPGRSPGKIKPDVLAFGGSADDYFHFAGPGHAPDLLPGTGTSLASPFALHQAVAIRSLLGEELSPLAIRALLLHSAASNSYDKREVGWGKIPESIDEIVVSRDGVARVVYQGEVRPGKYLRAQVPIPSGGLRGRVRLSATFAFASPVDVQTPDAYTRAGLEVRFRPNVSNVRDGSHTPVSRTFFSPAKYADESVLRSGEGKWETVLRASQRMLGSTLVDPVFDIHYNARDGGGSSGAVDSLKYSLVITLEAPKHVDLYDEILAAYPNVLIAIEPDIEIPVTAN